MTAKVLSGVLLGAIGLYDLYMYTSNPDSEGFAYIFLVAGIVCLICSVNILCSKDH